MSILSQAQGGSASLLSQLHRALNILNVVWGKLFIQTFIGGLLCTRCYLENGDVAGVYILSGSDRQVLRIKAGDAGWGGGEWRVRNWTHREHTMSSPEQNECVQRLPRWMSSNSHPIWIQPGSFLTNTLQPTLQEFPINKSWVDPQICIFNKTLPDLRLFGNLSFRSGTSFE